MSDVDLKMLFDLLKEVREDQKKHGIELAKQSTILDNLDGDVKELKATVGRNTEDIAHHIRRTDLLQELHTDNQMAIAKNAEKIEESEGRLDKLEEPIRARAWVKAHLVTIGSVLTAIGSLAAFLFEKFGK